MTSENETPTNRPETRIFTLHRTEDPSGISGTGIVADGVVFPTGQAVMCWRGDLSSIVIYPNMETLEKIHLHHGKTQIVWGFEVDQELVDALAVPETVSGATICAHGRQLTICAVCAPPADAAHSQS